jgi:sugar/nucleoside kinase (ribokinase family)
MIKPNLQEAKAGVEIGRLDGWRAGDNFEGDDLATARVCGGGLFEKNQKPVFITLAAQGVLAVSEQGFDHIPGIPVIGEIDAVGAGDSVMAGLVAGLCAGGLPQEAAYIGNLAASITIQQLGTTGTASREQLRRRYEEAEDRG